MCTVRYIRAVAYVQDVFLHILYYKVYIQGRAGWHTRMRTHERSRHSGTLRYHA